MMEKLIRSVSVKLVEYLEKNGALKEKNKELYIYGFQIMFEVGINLVIIFLISWKFNMIKECCIFLANFMLLRALAGGFHLESFIRCCIISNIILSIVLILIKRRLLGIGLQIIFFIFSMILIVFWSDCGYFLKVKNNLKINRCRSILQGVLILDCVGVGISLYLGKCMFGQAIINSVCLMAMIILVKKVFFRTYDFENSYL